MSVVIGQYLPHRIFLTSDLEKARTSKRIPWWEGMPWAHEVEGQDQDLCDSETQRRSFSVDCTPVWWFPPLVTFPSGHWCLVGRPGCSCNYFCDKGRTSGVICLIQHNLLKPHEKLAVSHSKRKDRQSPVWNHQWLHWTIVILSASFSFCFHKRKRWRVLMSLSDPMFCDSGRLFIKNHLCLPSDLHCYLCFSWVGTPSLWVIMQTSTIPYNLISQLYYIPGTSSQTMQRIVNLAMTS